MSWCELALRNATILKLIRVRISSHGVGSYALDAKNIDGGRPNRRSWTNGLSARLEQHVVSQRRGIS
jgi:hypothetical protein